MPSKKTDVSAQIAALRVLYGTDDMPKEITLVKAMDGSLRPATEMDAELVKPWKVGQPVRVEATKLRDRSLDHHKLYWGGLLALAMDYWEPKGGLLAPSEVVTLKRFADWLDIKGGNSGAVRRACRAFLEELRDRRAETVEAPEKAIHGLHQWVKEQCGHYDLVLTPSGVRKEVKSINFNSMDQDAFNDFYRQAFSVVWKFILSRNFESEQEAQNVIDQLVNMG